MESIAVALFGGVVTLVGVLCFNSRYRAVMEIKIDLIFGQVFLDPAWRALVVALVMAVLSPVMVELDSGGTA